MRIALVSIGIAAALVASGSATVEQAQAAGMALLAATALVVLLEVVNVVGTWTWLVDPDTRIQWEAAIGVGAASLVTAICGVLSYGLIGLVAPVGVLFTVHLVGRLTHRRKLVDQSTDQSTAVDKSVDPEWQQYASQALIEPHPVIDPPTGPISIPWIGRPEDDEPHAVASMGAAGGKTVVNLGSTEPVAKEESVSLAPDPVTPPATKPRPEPTKAKQPAKRAKLHNDPTVREAAARIIAESEKRPSEIKLRRALEEQGHTGLSTHGIKVLLGNKVTTRPTTAELEAVS